MIIILYQIKFEEILPAKFLQISFSGFLIIMGQKIHGMEPEVWSCTKSYVDIYVYVIYELLTQLQSKDDDADMDPH